MKQIERGIALLKENLAGLDIQQQQQLAIQQRDLMSQRLWPWGGSTHNFLDEKAARKLGSVVKDMVRPLHVAVADGSILNPQWLPPQRIHDHHIPLREGVSPIIVRPYGYSGMQKDIIEKLIEKTLKASVIRPSLSPFFSPVVLV
ncbi:hypothetical protein AKJ16_DCAP27145 [Drosera capensis]